jgi:hypothetical protein
MSGEGLAYLGGGGDVIMVGPASIYKKQRQARTDPNPQAAQCGAYAVCVGLVVIAAAIVAVLYFCVKEDFCATARISWTVYTATVVLLMLMMCILICSTTPLLGSLCSACSFRAKSEAPAETEMHTDPEETEERRAAAEGPTSQEVHGFRHEAGSGPSGRIFTLS